jgi:hypothetical protein
MSRTAVVIVSPFDHRRPGENEVTGEKPQEYERRENLT